MIKYRSLKITSAAVLTSLGFLGLMGCGGMDEGGDLSAWEPVGKTAQALRPDTPGNNELFRFEPGDIVETYGSPGGHFLVHYTKMGKNSVPIDDTDNSGVPDFVENVGQVYDNVYTRYHGELGFRIPPSDESIPIDNGGDGRFDVYLVDFAGLGDGNFQVDDCLANSPEICIGYMVQENDYAGYNYPSADYANRILGSHEYFHAIQAAYDHDQGSIFAEGSAVWATEKFDASLKDFEYFADGYLSSPDRSLNLPLPGPVDPFSYGAGIYFQFLDERYGESMVRALWERSENGANGVDNPNWYQELDALFADQAQTSFAESFVEFATWNLFTGQYADPARGYKNGSAYPLAGVDIVSAPYMDDALRVFYASSQYYKIAVAGRSSFTAAVVPPKDAPGEKDGLVMLLVAARKNQLDPVLQISDVGAGKETINTEGADNAFVIVINTLQSGNSRRPGLCIGTPEEVEACKNTLVPPDPPPVMNPPDPNPMDKPPLPSEPPPDSGCACGIANNGAQLGFWALPLALLPWFARRRRK